MGWFDGWKKQGSSESGVAELELFLEGSLEGSLEGVEKFSKDFIFCFKNKLAPCFACALAGILANLNGGLSKKIFKFSISIQVREKTTMCFFKKRGRCGALSMRDAFLRGSLPFFMNPVWA